MRRRACPALALVAIGCGPGVEDGPHVVERCGSSDPVVLLELAQDETVDVVESVVAFEDRWLIGVRTYDETQESPRPVAERLVSVDACGGARRVLVDGASQVRPPQGRGEPWLACSEHMRVYWLDPSGQAPPRLVPGFETHCPQRLADGSLVGLAEREDRRNDLVRVDLDAAGGATMTTLAEVVTRWEWLGPEADQVVVIADVDEQRRGALRLLDVFGGDSATLHTEVSDVAVSEDGRFLAWMFSQGEPDSFGHGDWTLRELAGGTERSLGPPGRGPLWLDFHGESVSTVWIPHGEGCCFPYSAETEVLSLDTLDSVALDGLVILREAIDGTQLLDRGTASDWTTLVRDMESGDLRTVAGVPDDTWVDDDAFMVLEHRADPLRQSLVRLEAPSFTAQALLTDVYHPVRVADRHWVSVRQPDASHCGPLSVVVEGQGESVLVLDERAHVQLRPTPVEPTMPLVYLGCDEGGASSEVRLAALSVDG